MNKHLNKNSKIEKGFIVAEKQTDPEESSQN